LGLNTAKISSMQSCTLKMNDSAALTPRQTEVFAFLEERHLVSGFMPSLEEICAKFGFKSTNSARQHLRLIGKKGRLERLKGKPRAIRLTPNDALPPPNMVKVPLLGRIPAGPLRTAVEEVEAQLALPRSFFRGEELFALRVRGESMIEAGIFDGDIAVLNARQDADNGEIAAVLLDDEATLKRVYRSAEGLRLHPENQALDDIVVRPEDHKTIRIAGVLVGTLRKF